MLIDEGYRVDCSVVPGVDWSANPGAPGGKGGADYRGFPAHPYFLNPTDISTPGAGPLLEVPMTVRASGLNRRAPWVYRVPVARQIAHWIAPALRWLSPVTLMEGANLDAMLSLSRTARAEGVTHLEFMVHSSELMAGGNEWFRNADDIDRLYGRLEALFSGLTGWCRGLTLGELYDELVALPLQEAGGNTGRSAVDDAPASPALIF
jgi:hypothetical protein